MILKLTPRELEKHLEGVSNVLAEREKCEPLAQLIMEALRKGSNSIISGHSGTKDTRSLKELPLCWVWGAEEIFLCVRSQRKEITQSHQQL